MKKVDKYLLLSVVFIALIGMIMIKFFSEEGPVKYLVIEIDGKEYQRVEIDNEDSEEKYIVIEQPEGQFNRVLIIAGSARMIEANCPDKLCIHQGTIRGRGPLIVCLPNRVVLRIEGEEE